MTSGLRLFLQAGIGSMENHSLDLVVQGQKMIGPKGEKVGGPFGDVYRALRGNQSFPAEQKALVAELTLGMSFAPCRVLIRRDLPAVAEGFDTSLHGTEDSDLWIRAAIEGARFGRTKQCNTLYRRHPESASHDIGKMERNLSLLLQKCFSRPDAGQWFPQWLQQTAHGMIQAKMARKCFRIGDMKGWEAHLAEATRLISVPASEKRVRKRLSAILVAVPGSEPILGNLGAGSALRLAARMAYQLKRMRKS